jgi:hypothetical protein
MPSTLGPATQEAARLLDAELRRLRADNEALAERAMDIVKAAVHGTDKRYIYRDSGGREYARWGRVQADIMALADGRRRRIAFKGRQDRRWRVLYQRARDEWAKALRELRRLREIEDAARAWRAAWERLDDSAAAVERRRTARERLFAALDARGEE